MKNDFSSVFSVPNVPPKRFEISLVFMVTSSYSIFKVLHDHPWCKQPLQYLRSSKCLVTIHK